MTLDRAPKTAIKPQPGPQTQFLATPADVALYGGAAGGGKSWALLLEPLRHIGNKNFGAVVFRRTSPEIRNEGALWDESKKLYYNAAGKPHESDIWWSFPGGSSVTFAHLEHEKNVYTWQGSQVPLICFDELTHFTSVQFWYMLSRNRSTCGVRPYVRATCNPDVDSWVAELISWWINQDTGYAIPERAGILRWFIRVGEKLVWGNHPDELAQYKNPETGDPLPAKSLTFIPSKLTDNKVMMDADPGYMANLLALPMVERERLLGGNWKIRWQGQAFFSMANFLINGKPVDYPMPCDGVYGILDSATKTGKANDGSACTFFAKNRIGLPGAPLTILDYEYIQIEGALLISWLPGLFARGEELARLTRARRGFLGIWVEDKDSGQILIQQSRNQKLRVHAISSKLTSIGKDERALNVSGYVANGQVKISEFAYNKTVVFKDVSKNHLLHQIETYSIADPDAAKRADDIFDTVTYGIALGLGNAEGF